MTESSSTPGGNGPAIDSSMPHSARVWNYWLGGKDFYPVDRMVGDQVMQVFPDISRLARADRAFLGRAVRFLAGEAGIRQFLDIGTGIPAANNTHEVAQSVAPDSRVVYVDNDPIVLVHARALLASSLQGSTQYVEGDLRDSGPILNAAAATLDFAQPVALMLLGIMHLISDSEEPYRIVAALMDALPSGSYLALSHPAIDINAAQAEAQRRYNERVSTPQTLRTRDEVARFFDGLELVPPGLSYVHAWRPDPDERAPSSTVSAHGGVARKP